MGRFWPRCGPALRLKEAPRAIPVEGCPKGLLPYHINLVKSGDNFLWDSESLFLALPNATEQEEHPEKPPTMQAMNQAGGEAWKAMSEEAKAPYEALSTASKDNYAERKKQAREEALEAQVQTLEYPRP